MNLRNVTVTRITMFIAKCKLLKAEGFFSLFSENICYNDSSNTENLEYSYVILAQPLKG